MGTQTDYFNKIGYTGKYQIGDRIFGYLGKQPFVGTVGNDRCINGVAKEVTVHLDLPFKVDNVLRTVIIVKHNDIKSRLKLIE